MIPPAAGASDAVAVLVADVALLNLGSPVQHRLVSVRVGRLPVSFALTSVQAFPSGCILPSVADVERTKRTGH